MPREMPRDALTAPDLADLSHAIDCRFWADPSWCDCGAEQTRRSRHTPSAGARILDVIAAALRSGECTVPELARLPGVVRYTEAVHVDRVVHKQLALDIRRNPATRFRRLRRPGGRVAFALRCPS